MITQIFPENLQELDWEHGDFKENAQKLEEYIRYMRERIEYNGGQNSKRISVVVTDENGTAVNEGAIVAAINNGESVINLRANRIAIDSDHFSLTEDGHITATAGTIADWNILTNKLSSGNYSVTYTYTADNVQPRIDKIAQYILGNYYPTTSEWDELDINGDGVLDVRDTAVMSAIKLGHQPSWTTHWTYNISLSPNPEEKQIKITRTWSKDGSSTTITTESYVNGNGAKLNTIQVKDVTADREWVKELYTTNNGSVVNTLNSTGISSTGSISGSSLYSSGSLSSSGNISSISGSVVSSTGFYNGGIGGTFKRKYVTGTTSASGNINIGLGSNCYILSVRQLATNDRVCIPYQGNSSPTTSDCWWVHIMHDGNTYYTAAESCSLEIFYMQY